MHKRSEEHHHERPLASVLTDTNARNAAYAAVHGVRPMPSLVSEAARDALYGGLKRRGDEEVEAQVRAEQLSKLAKVTAAADEWRVLAPIGHM